jgi:putative transposase
MLRRRASSTARRTNGCMQCDTESIAAADLFEYIEVFYNRSRRHSSLGLASPVQFLPDWMKTRQTKDAAA